MYKFKASKYKNALPTVAKKEECISDITVETPVTFGNHATASAKLVAFCVGSAASGNVMVLDIDSKGRFGSAPHLDAHSNAITDMEFSPFNHCRLATAGADLYVKIWDLPPDGTTSGFAAEAVQKLSGFKNRPESVAFNPVAENVLAVSCGSTLLLYDIKSGNKLSDMDAGCDLIQSISWKKNGTLIALTSKDKRLLVCDPRKNQVHAESKAHGNHKESRVLWLGETDKLITTGFSNSRVKELKVWDISDGKLQCLQTEDFGSGTGILMPFYDEDTGMLFVAAKGESSMTFLEFTDNKAPHVNMASQQILQNQTKGMCMVPKLGVDAAACEVNRLFQLCQKMLVPIPWKVPRKSLREFPYDLFPETASDEPSLAAQEWVDGVDRLRKKTTLDPAKKKPLRTVSTTPSATEQTKQTDRGHAKKQAQPTSNVAGEVESTCVKIQSEKKTSPAKEEETAPTQPRYKPFAGVRKSNFRHWKATVSHPTTHVTNITPVSLTVPASSDVMRCSQQYTAVPMKGPGGQIAVIKLSKPGRMSQENSLTLQNGKAVTDLQWNPFNPSQISVALESCLVKVWEIPRKKFGETLENPALVYEGHGSRPVVLCYHPLAENVMASAEVEDRILIWDVMTGDTFFELSGGSAEVMSMAWSTNGKFLATSAKDKMLRIYEPRKSTEPKQSGPGPEGVRSSRIVWTCNDEFIVTSGFMISGCRTVSLHSTSGLASGPVSCEEYDNSPSVMILHYDADSSTLFFTSKGDTTMHSLEVSRSEPPHFFRLATFSSDSPFQSICFLPKNDIDPRKVEFAQAWSLTKANLHKLSFTVPRVKMEYFQDDLFPPTPVTWEKTMGSDEWVKGADKTPRKLDLQPQGMTPLSKAPPDQVKPKKYESYNAATYKTDEQKKEELLEAMSGKLDLDKKLEQDTMDGVDEEEWDDY